MVFGDGAVVIVVVALTLGKLCVGASLAIGEVRTEEEDGTALVTGDGGTELVEKIGRAVITGAGAGAGAGAGVAKDRVTAAAGGGATAGGGGVGS